MPSVESVVIACLVADAVRKIRFLDLPGPSCVTTSISIEHEVNNSITRGKAGILDKIDGIISHQDHSIPCRLRDLTTIEHNLYEVTRNAPDVCRNAKRILSIRQGVIRSLDNLYRELIDSGEANGIREEVQVSRRARQTMLEMRDELLRLNSKSKSQTDNIFRISKLYQETSSQLQALDQRILEMADGDSDVPLGGRIPIASSNSSTSNQDLQMLRDRLEDAILMNRQHEESVRLEKAYHETWAIRTCEEIQYIESRIARFKVIIDDKLTRTLAN
jgi:hypothetical protein